MFMGEFVKKNHTTKDRIRYYIELGLLTPIKKINGIALKTRINKYMKVLLN